MNTVALRRRATSRLVACGCCRASKRPPASTGAVSSPADFGVVDVDGADVAVVPDVPVFAPAGVEPDDEGAPATPARVVPGVVELLVVGYVVALVVVDDGAPVALGDVIVGGCVVGGCVVDGGVVGAGGAGARLAMSAIRGLVSCRGKASSKSASHAAP
jgi:hypothetical protein